MTIKRERLSAGGRVSMKLLLDFTVEVDDGLYKAFPKMNKSLLNELADDVAGAVAEHEKLEGFGVTPIHVAFRKPEVQR